MFTVQCSPNWTFIVHISGAMADCGDPLCCRLESGVAYAESQKAGRLSRNAVCLESWRLMIYLLSFIKKKTRSILQSTDLGNPHSDGETTESVTPLCAR